MCNVSARHWSLKGLIDEAAQGEWRNFDLTSVEHLEGIRFNLS